MNQTFDFHRFGLVVKLDFAEKGKNMLLLAALLVAVLLMMMLPIAFSNEYSGFREALHYIALFMIVMFGGSLYTSTALTQYTSPHTGIAAIMIPASPIEKFFSSLLMNLLFIVPFLILFLELHYYTLDIANAKLPADSYKYNHLPDDIVLYFCFSYFIVHAIVFLGSVYFSKASYIKTASFFIVLVLLVVALNLSLAYYFTDYPSKVVAFPLSSWKIWNTGQNGEDWVWNGTHMVFFPEKIHYLLYSFPIITVVSLWTIAYIRLKEKEI